MKCPKCGGNVLLRANVFTEGGQDDVVTCPLCGFLVLKPKAEPVMPEIRTGFYCSECREETVHHGRGLCRECYNRLKAEGTLDREYPKASHNYGECAECGEIKSIMARGLCGRCYKLFQKTGELDELYPVYGRRIDMASKKTTKECRACGREMEIACRGLCGRCYGRVTRAINSGLTEAEAEDRLMEFLEEISEVAGDGTGEAPPETPEREPVTEEMIDGWGVEPVDEKWASDEDVASTANTLLAAMAAAEKDDPKPRPMIRPASSQEWQLMRCEDLARAIHRALERRIEGFGGPDEIQEAGQWIMELVSHFEQMEAA